VLYPCVEAIRMSFFRYGMRGVESFAALSNIARIFEDTNFHISYFNTFVFVLLIVPSTIIISLFISVTIHPKKAAAASFYRVVFYIPTIASAVTVSLIWNWIYHPVFGILNYFRSLFRLEGVEWLSNPDTALLSLVVVILTISIGQPIILFSAAIGAIPEEYYEAATVDGASSRQKLMKITIPCLMPTALYVFVISTINAFQTFVPVHVLTGGGPQKATSTVVYELYEQAFRNSNFGYASAIGMILFLTIGVFTFFQFKLMYNRK
jgi:multiple sugar transport system permease protein